MGLCEYFEEKRPCYKHVLCAKQLFISFCNKMSVFSFRVVLLPLIPDLAINLCRIDVNGVKYLAKWAWTCFQQKKSMVLGCCWMARIVGQHHQVLLYVLLYIRGAHYHYVTPVGSRKNGSKSNRDHNNLGYCELKGKHPISVYAFLKRQETRISGIYGTWTYRYVFFTVRIMWIHHEVCM